jgi:hypothetical protein
MERRKFLKALLAVPVAGGVLRTLDWAAWTPAEAAAAAAPRYSCEVPAGTILPWAGSEVPPGYLPCDGRAVPQFAYRKLYSAIGDGYGPPDRFLRTRRFRLPDLRQRVSAVAPGRSWYDVMGDNAHTAAGNYTVTYASLPSYVIRT